MGAVVATLKLGDAMFPGKGAGDADRVQRGFRARAGEAHKLHRWDAFAQHLGQPNLDRGGAAEGYPFGCLLGQGPDNLGVDVPHDETGGVEHEVEVTVAVHVVDVVPLTALDENWIRCEVGRAPGAAPRQVLLGLTLKLSGCWGRLDVFCRFLFRSRCQRSPP